MGREAWRVKAQMLFVGLAILMGASLTLADESPSSVPLRRGKKQALLLPVKVTDSIEAEFLLDTGLGFNLISPQLASQLGLDASPNHKVRPVTGGELTMGRAKISALTVGNRREADLEVVIGEPRCFVGNDGETKVDGILSLAFFKNHPFTLDYVNQQVVLEDSDSLNLRKTTGTKVSCRVGDENAVVSIPLSLRERAADPPSPGGIMGLFSGFAGGAADPPQAWVEVHTGRENLMLDSKLMFTLKVDATGGNVTETEPTDQNGFRYRSWASHLAKVEVVDSPALRQERAAVVFRKLQAEGIMGQDFLRHYTVTFDLPSSELIFTKTP